MGKEFKYLMCNCATCGKVFERSSEWAYKNEKKTPFKYFCSWGCLRADERKTEEERAKRRVISNARRTEAIKRTWAKKKAKENK